MSTGVVALVLLLVPGAADKRDDRESSTVDLSADSQEFALRMSAESGYTKPSLTERNAIGEGVERVLDGKPLEAKTTLAAVGYIDPAGTVHLGIEVPIRKRTRTASGSAPTCSGRCPARSS